MVFRKLLHILIYYTYYGILFIYIIGGGRTQSVRDGQTQ
jgi:hypothetical protein